MKKIKNVICLLLISNVLVAQSPNSWTRVADYGGVPRSYSIGFSIDSFGYVGCFGYYYQTDSLPYQQYPNDLWQYNPYANVWTQKASFPGSPRYGGICFTIGTKAYVGLGQYYSDFWEYNPSQDTWTQKADFPGGTRDGAVAFSISNNGYIGLGYSDTGRIKNDIWKYNPTTDAWTQQSNFGGTPRQGAIGFSVENKGYVGLGYVPNNGAISERDIWEFDTLSDSWIPRAEYPGTASGGTFCFSIGGKAYIGTGEDSSSITSYNGFWEYNSLTDQWIQKDTFGGGLRSYATGFSIGNKGYAGTGVNLNIYYNDFWMYTPDSLSTGIRNIDASNISIYPDPSTDKISINNLPSSATLTISDMTGQVFTTTLSGQHIDVSALPAGVYCLHIQDSGGSVVRKFVKE